MSNKRDYPSLYVFVRDNSLIKYFIFNNKKYNKINK